MNDYRMAEQMLFIRIRPSEAPATVLAGEFLLLVDENLEEMYEMDALGANVQKQKERNIEETQTACQS